MNKISSQCSKVRYIIPKLVFLGKVSIKVISHEIDVINKKKSSKNNNSYLDNFSLNASS